MQRKLFLFFILLAVIAGAGCKKTYNYSLDQTVSPVANLFAPQDRSFCCVEPRFGRAGHFSMGSCPGSRRQPGTI